MVSSFSIAESTDGSRGSLALLRSALVIVFLWFGGMKFTGYEANGIAPLMANSPIMSWLHVLFGVQGASYCHRGARTGDGHRADRRRLQSHRLRARGRDVLRHLSHDLVVLREHTRGRRADTGGFPAISAPIGQFLLKDLVLLAASVCLLLASVRAVERSSQITTRASHMGHQPGSREDSVVLHSCSGSHAEAIGTNDELFDYIDTPKLRDLAWRGENRVEPIAIGAAA